MSNHITIAIMGGDLRQIAMAKVLGKRGFEIMLWGIDPIFYSSDDVISPCNEWDAMIANCRVLILPLPISKDGVHLNCPLVSTEYKVKLSKISEKIQANTIVFGGLLPSSFQDELHARGTRCFDYFAREEVQIRNAVPTAEGALAIAMNEIPITLSGAKSAVLGYGRIGKILSHKLRALDSDVTVFARKLEDLAFIESYGLKTARIVPKIEAHSLESLSLGYDVIFNTVPTCILDQTILTKIPKSSLIIDLASAPGGVDYLAAEQCGLRVIRALSLPGKYAPETAGAILSETIVEILKEEELLL